MLFGDSMPIQNPLNTTILNVSTLQTDQPILLPGGRLSLSASSAVADVESSTTLHYLPYAHNVLPLWAENLQSWVYRIIPEQGITITSPIANPGNFDLYAGLSSASPSGFFVTTQGWTSNTVRLRPLRRKNGILALNFSGQSEPWFTYLGTVRGVGNIGSATLTDTESRRFLYNAYNREQRRVLKLEPSVSWTYNSSTWRPYNNSVLNRIEIVDGIGTGVLDLSFSARGATTPGAYAQFGLAIDSDSVFSESYSVSIDDAALLSRMARPLGVGYHFCQALESVGASGTVTFYSGLSHGLQGVWSC